MDDASNVEARPLAAPGALVGVDVEHGRLAAAEEGSPVTQNTHATLRIRVVRSGSRTTIPHATVWADERTVDDIGSDGTVEFKVPPGLCFVGALPPPGSHYVALATNPVTGTHGSEHDLVAAAGATHEIELTMHRGAGMVGTLRDAGLPSDEGVTLACFVHSGGRWIEPIDVTADAQGRFEILGLEPGRRLLHPKGTNSVLFEPLEVELGLGELRHVELERLQPMEITIAVHPTFEDALLESGPPLSGTVDRMSPLDSRTRRNLVRRPSTPLPYPYEWTLTAFPGKHRLTLRTANRATALLMEPTVRETTLDVEPGKARYDVSFELLGSGPFVPIDCEFPESLGEHPVRLAVTATKRDGTPLDSTVLLGPDDRAVRIVVDRSLVSDAPIVLRHRGEAFATLTQAESTQRLLLSPPPTIERK